MGKASNHTAGELDRTWDLKCDETNVNNTNHKKHEKGKNRNDTDEASGGVTGCDGDDRDSGSLVMDELVHFIWRTSNFYNMTMSILIHSECFTNVSEQKKTKLAAFLLMLVQLFVISVAEVEV